MTIPMTRKLARATSPGETHVRLEERVDHEAEGRSRAMGSEVGGPKRATRRTSSARPVAQ
jgi:hypothetical protein